MAVYLVCYAVSFILAFWKFYIPSGLVLMAAAVWLYVCDFRRSGSLIHLRGLFSLSWVGGQGISCLKLSRLQGPWSGMTWLCFLAAFAGFWLTFEALGRQPFGGFFPQRKGERGLGILIGGLSLDDGPGGGFFSGFGRGRVRAAGHLRPGAFRNMEGRVLAAMAVILAVSAVCFAAETLVLGYVPLFLKGVPHAYSYFHLTGIHYFTVSCVLVPALSVIFLVSNRWRDVGKCRAALIMDAAALLIPILCVSRFQLILAVALAVLTWMAMDRSVSAWWGAGALTALIPFYVILTVARSHDVSYLNGIFEMKAASMPIFITQPYMYIANNYDNFNCLVEQLPAHTFGLKMLFPLWALTGLKFLRPELVNFPFYLTKEELTTVTLFYDAYYDFGIIGVLLFSCALGALAWYLTGLMRNLKNPVGYVFYAQVAMYFALAFFTTWFGNPTTWFWFALTGLAALFVGRAR